MESIDSLQHASKGAKSLAESVHSLRSGLKADKWDKFPKQVAKMYKLKAAGRFEEAPASPEEIMKREFPDGMTKPYGAMI
mmetsp:Transcript_59019/g.132918  ORF Transcript_59019/g.132918 Transcript_59019/m.132918 type:complete len:80 (-) Transcript_59019:86-325(-)